MKANIIRFSIFFSFTLFMITLYYFGQQIIMNYNFHFQSTFDFKPIMVAKTTVPIVLGLFLALPKFVSEWRRAGKWKYDWIKLLAIGVPALYIALIPIFAFISVKYFAIITPILGGVSAALQSMPHELAGYAVGYILIASLYKTTEENSVNYIESEKIEMNKDEQV